MKLIEEVEWIEPLERQKLKGAGIESLTSLLNNGSTSNGRKKLAKKTGIDPLLINYLTRLADLSRINNINSDYLKLLHESGVRTIPELARRAPENLLEKINDIINKKHKKVPQVNINIVINWIEQSRELPWIISY